MDIRLSVGTVVEFSTGSGNIAAICRHTSIGCTRYVMGFELLDHGRKRKDWSPLPATW
jgi:hypothetical protein